MIKHEAKYCPRCNSPFECKVGSILLCQCSNVKLSIEERDFVQSQFEDCLCANCLTELQTEYHQNKYHRKLKNILGIFYNPKSKIKND